MLHSIKVTDDVLKALQEEQRPRESYTDVIARLLDIMRALRGLEPILRGSNSFHEWKRQREAEAMAAIAQRGGYDKEG